jgi:hypothetical protein
MNKRYDAVDPGKLQYLAMFSPCFPNTRDFTVRLRKMEARMEIITPSFARVPTEYEFKSNEKGGRRFEKAGGLQCLPKAVRNWLLPTDCAIDIDIQRCASTILYQLGRQNSPPHVNRFPNTEDLLANYPARLQELGNDKEMMNRVFFGAGTGEDFPQWAIGVRHEMRNILAPMLSSKYMYLWTLAQTRDTQERLAAEKKWRKADRIHHSNIEGSFLSLVYQQLENEYVSRVDKTAQRLGMWDKHSTLMFDGILVSRVTVASGGALQLHLAPPDLDILQADANRATGLDLRLVSKPLEPVAEIDTEKVPERLVIRDHHQEASKVLLTILKDKVFYGEPGYFFCDNGVWVDSKERTMEYLRRVALQSNIRIETEDGDAPFTSIYKEADQVAKACMAQLPFRPDLSYKIVHADVGKVHFLNGYWQFTTEIQESTGCHGHFVEGRFQCVNRIDRVFPTRDAATMAEVKTRLLDAIFDNSEAGSLDVFMLMLARALAGCRDKWTGILVGLRDSGKSMLMQWVASSIGSLFARLDAAHFYLAKLTGDPSRNNAWALTIRTRRIAVISEAKEGKGGIMCGTTIKNAQSGKEGIEVRDFRVNESRPVFPLCTLFLLANDLPQVSPADALCDHSIVITLNNRFWSEARKNASLETRASKRIKIKDPSMEDLASEDRYKNALLWLILEAYKPSEPVPTPGMTEALDMGTVDTEESLIDSLVEITGDSSDFVRQKDLMTQLEQRHSTMSSNKAGRIIDSMMEQQGKKVAKLITRKSDEGGRFYALHGIRLKKPAQQDDYFISAYGC